MINNFNRSRFNQVFRLAENPRVKISGYFTKPPVEIRYSSNPVRMLEVPTQTPILQGKQIISATATQARFLIGSFVSNSDNYLYRAYEANYVSTLIRSVDTINPITNLPQKGVPQVIEAELWVNMEYAKQDAPQDINPIKYALLRSTTNLKAMDKVGEFLVRSVLKENGLYIARVEYDRAGR